ncbi:MAG: hypothetical protein ACRD18_05490 [Terriglobia bacterium]
MANNALRHPARYGKSKGKGQMAKVRLELETANKGQVWNSGPGCWIFVF